MSGIAVPCIVPTFVIKARVELLHMHKKVLRKTHGLKVLCPLSNNEVEFYEYDDTIESFRLTDIFIINNSS